MKVKLLSALVLIAMSQSVLAQGVPLKAIDFSKWADKTLTSAGIKDAKVVETNYPRNFTYCEQGSQALWRYDVMLDEHLEALSQGKTIRPVTESERRVMLDPASNECAAI